jgi:hypothetical protein
MQIIATGQESKAQKIRDLGRRLGPLSAGPQINAGWAAMPAGITRREVYQELQSIRIDPNAQPTTECCKQADRLFEQLNVKGYKLAAKRSFFARLLLAAKRAIACRGCVMYSRNERRIAAAELQVIDAAVAAGLFASYHSPPGSPRMSRLVPLRPLAELAEADPWAYDATRPARRVLLRDRSSKEDIAFDPAAQVPSEVGGRLATLNQVNGDH